MIHRVELAFLICDAFAMVLMLVPFMAHFRAWNTATCYMMFFTTLGCINMFVNTLVWHSSVEDYSPHWCDFSTKLQIGLSIALPLASLCINRRLASLRKAQSAPHPNARRREAIIDSLICLVPTVIFMAVHYTQQGHRYDLIEGFGCQAATYITEPAVVLVMIPPVVVSLCSCYFAVNSIIFFYQRHTEFEKFLRNSSSGMSRSQYIRLMLLAGSELAFSVPLTLFFTIITVKHNGVSHWVSWEDTKFNFNRHDTYTRYMLEYAGPWVIGSFETARWVYPFCCALFFVFFGMSAEVFRSYYDAVAYVSRRAFNKPMPSYEQYLVDSTARDSQPRSITLFGRTIVFYSPAAWKKANGSTINKSVSVTLPQHTTSDRVSTHRQRRDSLGLSIVSADGVIAALQDKDSFNWKDSPTDTGSSYNEKELDDVLKDLPTLDLEPLSSPLAVPAPTHARSPSRASDQLTIHVEVERSQGHL